MRIVLTKQSDRRHRLEIVRDDGTREAVELETRSLLLHDLVHYAVEAQLALRCGVWGRLAAGASLADLAADASRVYESGTGADAELAMAESLVGPMQSLQQGRISQAEYLAYARAKFPDAVDEAFVDGVLARLRALVGHWQATAFRGAMQLTWPPADTD